MTNEEARKILDDMYGDWRTDEEREALEVAIEALNDRPTEWIPVSERLIKDIYADIDDLDTYTIFTGASQTDKVCVEFKEVKKIINKHFKTFKTKEGERKHERFEPN